MKTIMDLKNDRKVLWEQTKALLDRSRDPKTGLVFADAVAQYNRMVAQIQQIGNEITRREEQAELER